MNEETQQMIERLTELEKRATPGPWKYNPTANVLNRVTAGGGCVTANGDEGRANFELLTQGRNALPSLLALVREMQGEMEGLRQSQSDIKNRVTELFENKGEILRDAHRLKDSVYWLVHEENAMRQNVLPALLELNKGIFEVIEEQRP